MARGSLETKRAKCAVLNVIAIADAAADASAASAASAASHSHPVLSLSLFPFLCVHHSSLTIK